MDHGGGPVQPIVGQQVLADQPIGVFEKLARVRSLA